MQRSSLAKVWGFAFFLFLVGHQAGVAQIDLRIETPKASYLQFSPIPFTIKIKNLGAGELRLTESQGKPWLEMVVQSRDGQLIAPEKVLFPPDKILKSGQSTSISVDLAPHYLIRDTGGYRARASVRLPSGETLMTDSLDFLVGRGEVIWTVPRGDGEERRIYSLLKFYEDPNMGLYLRVEVPKKIRCIPLAVWVRISPWGNLRLNLIRKIISIFFMLWPRVSIVSPSLTRTVRSYGRRRAKQGSINLSLPSNPMGMS